MGNVVPLRDPDAPLTGRARDAALAICRQTAARHSQSAFNAVLLECLKHPPRGNLGLTDVLQVFVEVFQAELEHFCDREY